MLGAAARRIQATMACYPLQQKNSHRAGSILPFALGNFSFLRFAVIGGCRLYGQEYGKRTALPYCGFGCHKAAMESCDLPTIRQAQTVALLEGLVGNR